jgi:lipopolysaccharide/colanic/teichoic acid biosynthesis glycosyltransferase
VTDTTYRTINQAAGHTPAKIYVAGKRLSDVLIALAALLILSPVMIIAALAIACEGKGPILYKQARTGFQRRRFFIYKFRTMSVMEDGEKAIQCEVNDPRVTSVGRYLRKLSIDELPQLVNVLRGDMSLVGPRPHPPALDKAFASMLPDYMERYNAKPGITGLAQILGYRGPTKNPGLMERRISADTEYVRRCSFLLDLWILLKTVPLVVTGQNAL